MKEEQIVLELTSAEALVLFEWLCRVDSSRSLPFEDPAEQEVLWRVEARLERVLVETLSSNYSELLAEAQRRYTRLARMTKSLRKASKPALECRIPIHGPAAGAQPHSLERPAAQRCQYICLDSSV